MRPPESFIAQPVRSLQTMLRVIASVDERIPIVIPDGIYGATTVSAVIAFQQYYNLPPTGMVDEITWNTIVDVYEESAIETNSAESIEIIMDPGQIYSLGDSGPYIFLLQSILIQLSIDHDDIPTPEHTGILDQLTSQSLSAFQKIAGLPQTGELNKKTWKFLANHFTLNAHHHTVRNRNTEYNEPLIINKQ